ncbi:MAG: PQQ-dependent sugar dehydrogenase [Saprospiraceae bacterium]
MTKNMMGSVVGILCLLQCTSTETPKQLVKEGVIIKSEAADFQLDTITAALFVPFGMDWLPDGRLLVTQRPEGKLNILDTETGALTDVCNLPPVHQQKHVGMMDVLVHPDYIENGWIYLAYTIGRQDSMTTTAVDRVRLKEHCLEDRESIFLAQPYFKTSDHYGCRLLIRDHYLFITIGDRLTRDSAQSLQTHNGKVIRLHDDGRIPADNPFRSTPNALPEIWSYGHRNQQGMAFHPRTGELWLHEHGPKGGDEVNIVRPGRNYGWPIITYGEEYEGGPVGAGITQKAGMEQPIYYYVPSIAPSGMSFYLGDAFPGWRGDLFIGAMAGRHLNRLVLEGNEVVKEERLLTDYPWRIRCVKQGPDGFLYLGVDVGMIIRLRPKVGALGVRL